MTLDLSQGRLFADHISGGGVPLPEGRRSDTEHLPEPDGQPAAQKTTDTGVGARSVIVSLVVDGIANSTLTRTDLGVLASGATATGASARSDLAPAADMAPQSHSLDDPGSVAQGDLAASAVSSAALGAA